jgi:hypothetical protein
VSGSCRKITAIAMATTTLSLSTDTRGFSPLEGSEVTQPGQSVASPERIRKIQVRLLIAESG